MRARSTMIAALALAASACGPKTPEAPPVLIEGAQARSLYWSGDLDGQRIALDGYVNLDNGPTGDAIAMGPQLTSRPQGRGDELVAFDVARGEGPNQLNLPVLKTSAALPGVPAAGETLLIDMTAATFQDSAGKPHKLREKARVIGRLVYPRFRGHVVSDEYARSPTGRRFRPVLTDAVIDVAP
ncbi:hypothetical protein BH09PSE1_BH09PSE1_02360 [soil metagenome]